MFWNIKGAGELDRTLNEGVNAPRKETAGPELSISILVFTLRVSFLRHCLWIRRERGLKSIKKKQKSFIGNTFCFNPLCAT